MAEKKVAPGATSVVNACIDDAKPSTGLVPGMGRKIKAADSSHPVSSQMNPRKKIHQQNITKQGWAQAQRAKTNEFVERSLSQAYPLGEAEERKNQ